MGVRDTPNELIRSYLTKKTQKVLINNLHLSSERIVEAGIPQGSIVGPLLLIIFMNNMDISCSTPNLKKHYADDSNYEINSDNMEDLLNRSNGC